jgi:hypothetical protein
MVKRPSMLPHDINGEAKESDRLPGGALTGENDGVVNLEAYISDAGYGAFI